MRNFSTILCLCVLVTAHLAAVAQGQQNASSPVFDSHGVLFIAGVYDGDEGLKTAYTLRAVSMKAGMTASDPATFSYTIDRRDRTAYVSEETAPGVRMIRDSDNDKMFLIRGTRRYALIDSGMGRGALHDYIAQFTGGLPLVAIWTHSHDHFIGLQADREGRLWLMVHSGSRAMGPAIRDHHLEYAELVVPDCERSTPIVNRAAPICTMRRGLGAMLRRVAGRSP